MIDSDARPSGPENPYGLALVPARHAAAHRGEGTQDYNWATQRGWKVVNPSVAQRARHPGRLQARARRRAFPPCWTRGSPVLQRAEVIGHTLWVTPHRRRRALALRRVPEPVASDDAGLPRGPRPTGRSRTPTSCSGTCSASTTSPAPEDWPVMPVDIVSFWLKPFGFFDRNPALDVPPQPAHCDHP